MSIDTSNAPVGSSPTDSGATAPDSGSSSPAPSGATSSNGNDSFVAAQTIPPNSWSREYHEDWAVIPERTRQFISRRESEAHKAITEYGQKLSRYEPFEQVLSKYSDHLPKGIAAHEAVGRLIEAEVMLRNNPAAMFPRLAQAYGVDIGSLPQVAELRQQIAAEREQLAQREQQFEQQTAVSLNEFAATHPHFEQVRKLMGSLIGDGHVNSLEEAYTKAVRVSGLDVVEQETKRTEEAARKAKEARMAARVNVRSDTASRHHEPPRTMAQSIEQMAAKIYGR